MGQITTKYIRIYWNRANLMLLESGDLSFIYFAIVHLENLRVVIMKRTYFLGLGCNKNLKLGRQFYMK